MQTVKEIGRDEKLYRVIKRSMPKWVQQLKDEQGCYHPTPAMYKDDKGISVDRDEGRKEDEVIQSIKEGQFADRTKGIAAVSASYCFDIDVRVVHAPTTENKYHSNIFLDSDDEEKRELQSLQLADASKIVYFDPTMSWIDIKTGKPIL